MRVSEIFATLPKSMPHRNGYEELFAGAEFLSNGSGNWIGIEFGGIETQHHRHCAPKVEDEIATTADHRRLIESLLTEAIACRTATVPPSAFVECVIRPFVGVHLVEKGNFIYFAWEDREARLSSFCLDVSGREATWGLPNWLGAADESVVNAVGYVQEESLSADDRYVATQIAGLAMDGVLPAHIVALQFLSAAVLRDFWVVEDKESNGLGAGPRFRRVLGKHSRDKRVIYLPRVRYRRDLVDGALHAHAQAEPRWSVSPHWVRSHFRVLPSGMKATPRQVAIASLHGANVEPGETWVRGHAVEGRGDVTTTVYRSRCATKTLLEVIDPLRSDEVLRGLSWFSFERLCERMLEERGLEIVSKVGDGGIDIVAVDKGGGHVLVQAKHWAKPVGPGAVQATAGARDGRYAEVAAERTIVMSSSGFSEGARREASRLDIELITVRSGH